mmetsp:Transcript_20175/g.30929  ORF Transcript_20175/g.30929 Transcript_20175/m.30929 type:complete len:172 (-) Transcript_20175:425-940(-)
MNRKTNCNNNDDDGDDCTIEDDPQQQQHEEDEGDGYGCVQRYAQHDHKSAAGAVDPVPYHHHSRPPDQPRLDHNDDDAVLQQEAKISLEDEQQEPSRSTPLPPRSHSQSQSQQSSSDKAKQVDLLAKVAPADVVGSDSQMVVVCNLVLYHVYNAKKLLHEQTVNTCCRMKS